MGRNETHVAVQENLAVEGEAAAEVLGLGEVVRRVATALPVVEEAMAAETSIAGEDCPSTCPFLFLRCRL